MTDLVQWLRAQLDADAEQACAATEGPWWHNPGKQWLGPEAFEKYDLRQGEEFVGYGGPHPFTGAVCSTGPASNMQGMKDAAFIAEHDPARVLREVEAKRQLLADVLAESHFRNEEDNWYSCAALTDEDGDPVCPDESRAPGPCDCGRDARVARRLRLLALPYEDRPGFAEAIASVE